MKLQELFENQEQYPLAGQVVDGLTVRRDVPNTSSISASLTLYEVLKGIREVPMTIFGGPRSVFYAADDFKRSEILAQRIAESEEINPLIIVIDKEGPYILEGAHRYVALYYLKKTSFPALVVLDVESLDSDQ